MKNFMPYPDDLILYRAQGIYSKEWYKGYLWRGVDRAYIIESNLGVAVNKHTDGIHDELKAAVHQVKMESIGIRSARTDKTTKNIYAGDIVLFQAIETDTYERGLVVFDGCNFCVKFYKNEKETKCFLLSEIPEHNIEIIGCYFDNPELIKGFYYEYQIMIKSADSASSLRLCSKDNIDEAKKMFLDYLPTLHRYKHPVELSIEQVKHELDGSVYDWPKTIQKYIEE